MPLSQLKDVVVRSTDFVIVGVDGQRENVPQLFVLLWSGLRMRQREFGFGDVRGMLVEASVVVLLDV